MMRTPADDAAWVAKCQAATERLKAKEATAKVVTSAQKGVGARDMAQPKLVEAALGATRLDRPGGDGQELGSTTMALRAVEADKEATSARKAERADVKKTEEVVVEAP
jgi:hypothetical protein